MIASGQRTRVLGVKFFNGPATVAVEVGMQGGLIVVPSAPVLVDVVSKPALRDAVFGADLAITDSGLMVLLWRLLTREKLERVSGLEYLKLLLERLQQQQRLSDGSYSLSDLASHPITNNQKPITQHAAGGGVLWVMPTAAARDRNLAWLQSTGHRTTVDDCYVAPVYPAEGPLSDDELLSVIRKRRPAHIILALGGGVQERLGFALRQSLAKAESGKLKAEGPDPSAELTSSAFSLQSSAFPGEAPLLAAPRQALGRERVESAANPVFVPKPASAGAVSGKYRPGIHCIGAAIGFLSGEQVRIPMWVDFLYLGWFWRSVSAPRRFVPRYWKAFRLIPLMIRYGAKAPGVVDAESGKRKAESGRLRAGC